MSTPATTGQLESPPAARESKPGYLTTEFWVTLLTLVLNNLSVLPIPDKYQGLINVLVPIGYALSRGLAKSGQPDVVGAVTTMARSAKR